MKDEHIERIERCFKSLNDKLDQLIDALNGFGSEKKTKKKEQTELSPFQKAVKTATAKNSSDEDVKTALTLFTDSTQQLTPSQVAFCLYFLSINKPQLGEDVNYWLSIEIGKHKYNERSDFIQKVVGTLEQKYSSNQTVVNGLKLFLEKFKRK